MKREVIFRGWDPIEGKWIYGSGVHSTPFRTYLLTDAGRLLEVEPETVGEWTGLHSNTGRKIFEGDVVSVKPHKGTLWIGVVKFHVHTASFDIHHGDYESDWFPLQDDFVMAIHGNIFEDEDLKNKYWEIYQK